MPEKSEKPAEFTSDEQRDAHIAALKVELEHLEASAEAEAGLGNEAVAKRKRGRLEGVTNELQRLGAGTAEKRLRGTAKETR